MKCPNNCKPVRIMEGSSLRTLVYYPRILNEKGVNINPDKNTTTTTFTCQICGCRWTQSFWYGGKSKIRIIEKGVVNK